MSAGVSTQISARRRERPAAATMPAAKPRASMIGSLLTLFWNINRAARGIVNTAGHDLGNLHRRLSNRASISIASIAV
jgi:hypothetical protein